MKTPLYTRFEFVDATAFSTAASQLASNVSFLALAQTSGGLFRPDVITTSSAGLVLTVHLPAPFALQNSSGALAGAHGVVDNQDTTAYTVNYTALVPPSGSQVVYLSASLTTINQDPYQVVGPSEGHPSFQPGFIPFTAYATIVDTIALTATTTVPNNTTAFEIGRFTLNSGASTLPALDTSHQILMAPLPIQNTIAVTGNKTLARLDAGVIQQATGTTQTFTLPDALANQAEQFTITAKSTTSCTLQISTVGNLIFGATGDPTTGVTSFLIPLGWTVTVVSDGVNWQVISSSGLAGASNFVQINAAGNSNITLTAAQAAANFIQFFGALTGNILVLIPATATGTWSMRNATTGAFTITAQYQSGGTTIALSSSGNGTTQISGTGGNLYYAGSNFLTQSNGDSSTNAATTAFVHNYVGSLSLVNSFNTRTGAVTLTSADVTNALGYSPVQSFNSRTGVVTLTSTDVTNALTYTPVNNGGGTIIGAPVSLIIDGGVSNFRRFGGSTGGVLRWQWGTNIGTESGGNTGSNWVLNSYTDAGAINETVLTFNRATGVGVFSETPVFPTQAQGDNSTNGATTRYVDVGLSNTLNSAQSYTNGYALPLTGGTVSGNLTVGDGSGGRQIIINGVASSFRTLFYQSNGANRWHLRTNSTPESGSNVGSDWNLTRYADDGVTSLGAVISAIRSTGVVNIPSLTTATQAQGDNSTNAATTAYADRLGFGPNNVVHDVSGSRSIGGGPFTNNQGRMMFVSITFGTAPGSSTAVNVAIVINGTTQVAAVGAPVLGVAMNVCGFVPAGATYQAVLNNGSATFTSVKWIETW
jgi:hypothetical protein